MNAYVSAVYEKKDIYFLKKFLEIVSILSFNQCYAAVPSEHEDLYKRVLTLEDLICYSFQVAKAWSSWLHAR